MEGDFEEWTKVSLIILMEVVFDQYTEPYFSLWYGTYSCKLQNQKQGL
jgi:hypothetical protein